MTPFRSVRTNCTLAVLAVALAVAAATPARAESAPATPTKTAPACNGSEAEKTFFDELKRSTPRESGDAIQGSPCRSTASFQQAFAEGFSQAFEARRYFPTFGRFGLPPPVAARLEPSQEACVELRGEGKTPQARACCLAGYARGEAAFKARLRTADVIPARCSDDFHRGSADAQRQCESIQSADASRCFLSRGFSCLSACYSYGWNEVLAPCLEQSRLVGPPGQGRTNRGIDFRQAYSPAPASPGGGASGPAGAASSESAR